MNDVAATQKTSLALRWKLYFFLWAFLTVAEAITFFEPSSEFYVYYHILIAFNKAFYWPYVLNLLAIIVEIMRNAKITAVMASPSTSSSASLRSAPSRTDP